MILVLLRGEAARLVMLGEEYLDRDGDPVGVLEREEEIVEWGMIKY